MSSDYGKLILPTETNIAAAAKRYAAISSSKRTLKKKNGRNPGQNNHASDHTLMKKLRDVLKLNPFHWNANFDIASVLSALEKPQFNRSSVSYTLMSGSDTIVVEMLPLEMPRIY